MARFSFSRFLQVAVVVLGMAAGAAFAETKSKDAPFFEIQRSYLKQMMFEQPNSPAIFLELEAPTVDVKLDTDSSKIAGDTYEVWVETTVTLKVKDKIALIVTGKQAGIFTIRNVPANQMGPLLAVGCPNVIYPYLRANIADAITRAGFAPVNLAEINWEAFNKQRLNNKK